MFTKTMIALFTTLIVGTSSAALAMTQGRTNVSQLVSKSRSAVLRVVTSARETKASECTITTPMGGSGLQPIW
jgi:hypothetical protein